MVIINIVKINLKDVQTMKTKSLSLILIILLATLFTANVFADSDKTFLNNWIEIKNNNVNERVTASFINFDEENETFLLNARIGDEGADSSFFGFDGLTVIPSNPTTENCDFTGGWVGTTDQGKEIIFIVSNISDITRVQIDVILNSRSCNKNFGTGFSGSIGTIAENSFGFSDIVVCGIRLGIKGVFTSCNEIEGEWFFYCPSCGSASGTWDAVLDNTSPSDISNFKAMPGDAKVSLSWENPPGSDFKGVRIQRSQTNQPGSPDEGITVFSGFSSGFEDTCVSNGKQYFYTAFTFDSVSNFSPGVNSGVELELVQ